MSVVWEEIVNGWGDPCVICRPYVGTVHRRGEGPQPPFHRNCRCYRRVLFVEFGEDAVGKDEIRVDMQSEPVAGVLAINGRPVDDSDRRELKRRLDVGDLDAIEFDAVVFRAVYPNANFYRFRDGDLGDFSSSYAGQPFLRNHGTGQIENRDGTIRAAGLSGREFVQTVQITTERGMRSFLEGQIDRFSIGWYFEEVTCAVCNERWFGCSHWPGRRYVVRDGNGKESEVLCEIIFEKPRGKETSAVNAPAVSGTHILSELCARKVQFQKESGMSGEVEVLTKTPGADAVGVTLPGPGLDV